MNLMRVEDAMLLAQVVLETLGEGPHSEAESPPSITVGTPGRRSLASAGSLPVVKSGEGFRSAPELQGEHIWVGGTSLHGVTGLLLMAHEKLIACTPVRERVMNLHCIFLASGSRQ